MAGASWMNKAIEKEEQLRLKWFINNEEQLVKAANKPMTYHVQEKELKELTEARQKLHANVEKYPRIKTDEDPAPPADYEDAKYSIMRPVPPKVTSILYKSSNEGRKRYLHKRFDVLPENRYYFPETTSFCYGWKMWECAKTMEGSKFGKCPIVKQSFYRRRAGIERDPDWYTTPSKLSPTICNSGPC